MLFRSVEAARVLREVADSMIAAGGPEAAIDSVMTLLESGDVESLFGGGGGAGRGGAESEEWVARPGERYPTPEELAERERAEAAEREAGTDLEDVADDMFDAVDDRGFDFDFDRGGDDAAADPGEYTVVLMVGPHELRSSVTVIRAADYQPPPPDREAGRMEEEHAR